MNDQTKRTLIISISVTICIIAVCIMMIGTINVYNKTERDRGVACTEQHGIYKDGSCVYSG